MRYVVKLNTIKKELIMIDLISRRNQPRRNSVSLAPGCIQVERAQRLQSKAEASGRI